MMHIHLVGGPFDGETLEFAMEEDDIYPDMIVVPVSDKEGELYEIAEEDYVCGFPKYLYSGYDWEPVGGLQNWEDE